MDPHDINWTGMELDMTLTVFGKWGDVQENKKKVLSCFFSSHASNGHNDSYVLSTCMTHGMLFF